MSNQRVVLACLKLVRVLRFGFLILHNACPQIRRHAVEIYNKSGKPKVCLICNYSNSSIIKIAHIRPVSKFSNNTLVSEINNINNLVALCPTHHDEYDAGIISL